MASKACPVENTAFKRAVFGRLLPIPVTVFQYWRPWVGGGSGQSGNVTFPPLLLHIPFCLWCIAAVSYVSTVEWVPMHDPSSYVHSIYFFTFAIAVWKIHQGYAKLTKNSFLTYLRFNVVALFRIITSLFDTNTLESFQNGCRYLGSPFTVYFDPYSFLTYV